jgi:type I restriction enzyme S subunit
MEEQRKIIESIDSETVHLVTAILRIEREIELLREYRTRLIADVVTGKLDVREAARHLPDEAEEPEASSEPDTDEVEDMESLTAEGA